MARPAAAGFTLLEVMVAFVIAALALAVLFRGASDGLQGTARAARYQDAVVRARSHLAASGLDPAPGETSGDDGSGFTFRVRTRKLESWTMPLEAAPAGARPRAVTLYAVTVWESWAEGAQVRDVRLDSERLDAGS